MEGGDCVVMLDQNPASIWLLISYAVTAGALFMRTDVFERFPA